MPLLCINLDAQAGCISDMFGIEPSTDELVINEHETYISSSVYHCHAALTGHLHKTAPEAS